MTSKSKSDTPTITTPPVNYVVYVNVDKNGAFTYTDHNGADARTLRPNMGDTISWFVSLEGEPCPFQIYFPGFGPFGYTTRTIRSSWKPTERHTVTMPKGYAGNLVMAYRVTVPGAWSDDPDVIPPASDGTMPDGTTTEQVITLDTSTGSLKVNPPSPSFPEGEVTWEWLNTKMDDFALTFTASPPPSGWPTGPNQSVNAVLVLPLTTRGTSPYTIQTVHTNQTGTGSLTIA